MQRQRRPAKMLDRLLLRMGAATCGVILALGIFAAQDWPRRLLCLAVGLAGLGFYAWVARRYFI